MFEVVLVDSFGGYVVLGSIFVKNMTCNCFMSYGLRVIKRDSFSAGTVQRCGDSPLHRQPLGGMAIPQTSLLPWMGRRLPRPPCLGSKAPRLPLRARTPCLNGGESGEALGPPKQTSHCLGSRQAPQWLAVKM